MIDEQRAEAGRWPTRMRVTVAAFAGVALVFAVLVYMRRWMSDDGLIVVRVAREIHEGFGPNYNPAARQFCGSQQSR